MFRTPRGVLGVPGRHDRGRRVSFSVGEHARARGFMSQRVVCRLRGVRNVPSSHRTRRRRRKAAPVHRRSAARSTDRGLASECAVSGSRGTSSAKGPRTSTVPTRSPRRTVRDNSFACRRPLVRSFPTKKYVKNKVKVKNDHPTNSPARTLQEPFSAGTAITPASSQSNSVSLMRSPSDCSANACLTIPRQCDKSN